MSTDQLIAILVAFLLVSAASAVVFLKRRTRHDKAGDSTRNAYRLATEMASDAFYVAHPAGGDPAAGDWIIADCNERGAACMGLRKHELIGRHLSQLYSAASFPRVQDIFAKASANGFHEEQYEVPAGSPLKMTWAHLQVMALKPGLAIALRDISSDQEHALEMLRLANEDPTTGLPNRKWLTDFLSQTLREPAKKLAVLFIDIDDFRNVNDSLGHPVGDLLLRAIAMRLKSVIGEHDRVVRFGGDEFVIVLTETAHQGEARRMAELVNEILRFPLALPNGRKSVTTSIGVSIFPADGGDAHSLLKSAEIAMYAAKNNGKAQYRLFDPTLYESRKGRLALEQDLAEAIAGDQFILLYEPRMHLATGRPAGMEALVRWIHPERGLVPPLEFIPLAESTGMIIQLGELVIDKVFRQIALWQQAGIPMVPVSINISAQHFNHGQLCRTFRDAFDKYGIPSRLVQIELTESVMLGEQDAIMKELADLRSLGVKLLIDDFGTGYSSLAQLQRLKMDVLKVDRAFLKDLERTQEAQVFVRAIVSMAHALGMEVIAEGVETRTQLDVLRGLSCDEIQGYYLSKPLSVEAMSAYLTRGGPTKAAHQQATAT